jgi:hypothetical protein
MSRSTTRGLFAVAMVLRQGVCAVVRWRRDGGRGQSKSLARRTAGGSVGADNRANSEVTGMKASEVPNRRRC